MVFISKNDTAAYRYLNEASKYPALTKQEQIDVFNEYQKTGNIKLKNKLINSNLLWVVSLVKKYAKDANQFCDMVNSGNEGLIVAFDKFDPNLNMSFTSFSTWYIELHIKSQLEQELDVYLPYNVQKVLKCINKLKEQEDKVGNSIEISKLIELYNKNNENKIDEQFYDHIQSFAKKLSSVNDDLEGGETFENYIVNENNINAKINKDHLNTSLNDALSVLDERERYIVEYKFGMNGKEELTLNQISENINLTRERVGQLLQKALNKLKENKEIISKYF